MTDGASVRAQHIDGEEPLHLACDRGHLDITIYLLVLVYSSRLQCNLHVAGQLYSEGRGCAGHALRHQKGVRDKLSSVFSYKRQTFDAPFPSLALVNL